MRYNSRILKLAPPVAHLSDKFLHGCYFIIQMNFKILNGIGHFKLRGNLILLIKIVFSQPLTKKLNLGIQHVISKFFYLGKS